MASSRTARDGWLFLADDRNEVFAQHTGAQRFDDADLDALGRAARTTARGFRGIGAARTSDGRSGESFGLSGEASAGNGAATRTARAPIDRRISDRAGSPVPFVYPLDEMVAGKDVAWSARTVDSHWTDFGAFSPIRGCWTSSRGCVPPAAAARGRGRVPRCDRGRRPRATSSTRPASTCSPSGSMRYPHARLRLRQLRREHRLDPRDRMPRRAAHDVSAARRLLLVSARQVPCPRASAGSCSRTRRRSTGASRSTCSRTSSSA